MKEYYWECGDSDEKAIHEIRKLVADNVKMAVKQAVKGLNPGLSFSGGKRDWRVSYFDIDCFNVETDSITLPALFKRELNPQWRRSEDYDSLIADLEWCIKYAKKIQKEAGEFGTR